MTDTPTCNWTGASGFTYTYHMRELPVSFPKDNYGNYIYSKLNWANKWVPIYIGEGDLSDRVSDNHHQSTCIKSKDATHVHVHLNDSETVGKAEETDLLARYTNTFKPSGCNERPGG